MFGISKRPLTSREPGGIGRPPGRVHRTRARIGPSSRHWNTTSRPVEHNEQLETKPRPQWDSSHAVDMLMTVVE